MSNAAHYSLVPKDVDANIRFRRDMLTMCGNDRKAAAQVKKMCAEDLLFYVNAFCWTYDPRPGKNTFGNQSRVPFITYEFQDRAMTEIADCIENGHDFAIPKSRDMGASWVGLTVFEWFWHFRNDMSFLMISRNENYVDVVGNPKCLFWKIDFLHENQPRWLLPTGRCLGWDDPGRKLLHFRNADNKSVIDGESTTGDAGRGDRRTAMFIDEHAAFELNDGFRVLNATRDTTKCRGFNSTHQGCGTAFYEVCTKTTAKIIRLHWSEHPEKNRGLYTTQGSGDQAKPKLLDSWRGIVSVREKGEKHTRKVRFPEEYPFKLDGKTRSPWYDGEEKRCLSAQEVAQELDIDPMGSASQFFDPETIAILRKKDAKEPIWVGDIEYDRESSEPKRLVEDPKGKLMLWMPLDKNGRVPVDMKFVLGADISAGTGASNSALSIGDKRTGEKVGVWKDSQTRPNEFARLSMAVSRFFGNAMLVFDRSGPTGENFAGELSAHGFSNLYFRRSDRKVGREVTDTPGVFLNPAAKTTVLENYREALGIGKFINRSDRGLQECLQFIRTPTGHVEHSAALNTQDPSGARTAHGDEVISDALCSLGIEDTQSSARQGEAEIPPGSLADRQRKKRLQMAQPVDRLSETWG